MSYQTSFHCQCLLRRDREEQTVWVPESFATEGRVVKILDERNQWSDGWTVARVGTRLESAYVKERERDYLKTRQASDR